MSASAAYMAGGKLFHLHTIASHKLITFQTGRHILDRLQLPALRGEVFGRATIVKHNSCIQVTWYSHYTEDLSAHQYK